MARKRKCPETGLEEPPPKRQARSSCSTAMQGDVESTTETYNLLLGVTQSGKSTAGNAFTVSIPVDYRGANFKMGSGNVSCTVKFKSAATTWNNQRVNFLDGPGLGETKGTEQEELNLYRLYRGLAAMGASNKKLSLIVIVVSFDGTLLDERYKGHLQFYKRLFPTMFNANNAVILVTAYHANRAWQTQRGRDGHMPQEKLQEKLNFIHGILGVRLQHYCADFLSEDAQDVEHAKEVRRGILKKSIEVAKIDLSSNLYPKLPGIKADDDRKIDSLNQERDGIERDLPEHKKTLELLENEVMAIVDKLQVTEGDLRVAVEELTRLLSSPPYQLFKIELRSPFYHLSASGFKKHSSAFPITDHSVQGDEVRFTKTTRHVLAGEGKKKLLRPYAADVLAYTSAREFHKGEIAQLRKRIDGLRGEIGDLNCDLKRKERESRRARNNVEEREARLDSISRMIHDLEQDMYTFEQVCERFRETYPHYEGEMP